MYYLIFVAGIVLLAFLTNKSEGNPFLGSIVFVYCVLGFSLSLFLPEVYVVSADGTVRRKLGTLPWVTRSVDSVTFTPLPDSTYIVNPSRQPIRIGKVLYTDLEELVGAPVRGYDVRPDTVTAPLLTFPTARVSPFREAPSDVTTGSVRGIEMVSVVSIPNREPELQSLSEGRYLLLRKADDTDYVATNSF